MATKRKKPEEKRPGPGRPTAVPVGGEGNATTLGIRVKQPGATKKNRAPVWKRAAREEGKLRGDDLSVNAWIRLVANRAVESPPPIEVGEAFFVLVTTTTTKGNKSEQIKPRTAGGLPLTVRVRNEDLDQWKRAAASYGAMLGRPMSVAAWLAMVCDYAADPN